MATPRVARPKPVHLEAQVFDRAASARTALPASRCCAAWRECCFKTTVGFKIQIRTQKQPGSSQSKKDGAANRLAATGFHN